jgi:hypothetical protein
MLASAVSADYVGSYWTASAGLYLCGFHTSDTAYCINEKPKILDVNFLSYQHMFEISIEGLKGAFSVAEGVVFSS